MYILVMCYDCLLTCSLRLLKLHLKNLPLLDPKLPFMMPREPKTSLLSPVILLAHIITNGKLSTGPINISPIDDTNITTAKHGSFLPITAKSKLRQIQLIFLAFRQWKQKRLFLLVGHPLLFVGFPLQRSVPTDDLVELGLEQQEGVGDVVAEGVECGCAEWGAGGAVQQAQRFYRLAGGGLWVTE